MTPLRYGLVALTIAVLISMGPGAGSAQAHPTLLFTEPTAETAVATSPEAITLLFNEPVTIGMRAIVVLDQSRRDVPVGPANLARDGRFVAAAPVSALAPGTYAVRWRVTGGDGDQVEQEFRFAVGVTLSAAAPTASATPAWGESALRWLLFAGLAAAVGGLIGRRAIDAARAARPDLSPVRSWAPAGMVVALIAAMALVASRALDAGTVSAVWDGRAGVLLLIEAGGLLTALALASRGRWALVPLAVVIAADGIRSHAGTTFGGWGAVLTGVHLAAVTVWVGALVHTTRAVVAWRAVPNALRWVLASYVRLAVVTYLVVVATGVISALVLVPLPQLVSTTYGKVLLIKLGLVVAASAAALSSRLIHRDTRQATRIRRAMAIEAALLVVVLAASAVLVSTPPPTGTAAALPPQPTGPVVSLGTLAGQVGISLTASEGLLVVRLSTPRRGDYYAAEPGQDYSLAASLGESALALTGCGSGCYFTRLAWRDGDNVLTLRAGATGWPGGDTGLIVSWPPRPGAADLAAAVAATRAAGSLVVYETVTSDTTAGPPEPDRLDLDAGFFLSQEPYADGTAPIAARTSPPGAVVRLALGYPAASINVQLTLDDRSRITEEILTDPKHLVTRRIVYPGPE